MEEKDGGLDVSLNDYSAKDLADAVKKYGEWKKAGGPPAAKTDTGSGPFTGTMDGLSGNGLVHFTIDKMRMDKTGLFHTVIRYHWESPKTGGGTSVNDVEAEVQYRVVPGYESSDNATLSLTVNGKPATGWYDAEQKGLFDYDYIGSPGVEVFHEDEWSDHATQRYFEAHNIPISPGDPLEGDDAVRVYEAAPDGAGTFI